jgi:hypothetical protein
MDYGLAEACRWAGVGLGEVEGWVRRFLKGAEQRVLGRERSKTFDQEVVGGV